MPLFVVVIHWSVIINNKDFRTECCVVLAHAYHQIGSVMPISPNAVTLNVRAYCKHSSCVRSCLYPCLVFDFLPTSFVIDSLRFSKSYSHIYREWYLSDRVLALDPVLKQLCLYCRSCLVPDFMSNFPISCISGSTSHTYIYGLFQGSCVSVDSTLIFLPICFCSPARTAPIV